MYEEDYEEIDIEKDKADLKAYFKLLGVFFTCTALAMGFNKVSDKVNPSRLDNEELLEELTDGKMESGAIKEYQKRHLGNSEYAVKELMIPGSEKVFMPGEHIIKINISSETDQIKYYDGYDIVGVSSINKELYGVYKNTVPVQATTDIEGEYYIFGTPIEDEKSYSKVKK